MHFSQLLSLAEVSKSILKFKESHKIFGIYQDRLEPGWLFGLLLDNSDHQYASFRKNIPALMAVILGHQILSLAISTSSNYRYRAYFNLVFSICFIAALFGSSALKILIILSINYFISKSAKFGVAFSWIFCISILFLNDHFKGYSLGPLENFRGLGLRWTVTFNFTILRMISFSMDRNWARNRNNQEFQEHSQSCLECSHPPNLCKRQRLEKCHDESSYSYLNYLAYTLYAPLYMAGPIVSFNDFWHQMKHKPASLSKSQTLWYAARWAFAVFLMEVMMHVFHLVAIKDTKAWIGFSAWQIFLVGFFNLKLIWLKLLIIWRFFRMWAMTDGVETIENMTRCMSNNYSTLEFWRDWHSSYNKWLIRYMYIPMGGSRYRGINMFPLFTFVAIWHDIEGRLLAWGWLIALFMLPEMTATRIFVNNPVLFLSN